ncbi:hypothetical protein U9M48_026590 [Paspalum notatum var. saurae]|uniref:Uncharacterized protein n=1 Tax=Paspalum notatum var. saurae TaxID=547442 RepID=A0AAQ3TSS6_PASNO
MPSMARQHCKSAAEVMEVSRRTQYESGDTSLALSLAKSPHQNFIRALAFDRLTKMDWVDGDKTNMTNN